MSELYYPEQTSTGHTMTVLAEGLAERFDVEVICAQPSYSARGQKAPRQERHHDVDITRVRSTSLDPHSLPLKAVNFLTVSLSCFWATLRRLRRGDHIFVVTNPPLLPFLVVTAARLRGATSSIIVHDLYPDVLVPAGVLRENSVIYKSLRWATTRLFGAADSIVTIGRDQAERIRGRLAPQNRPNVHTVRQAADLDTIHHHQKAGNIHLERLGLADADRIVGQFAGNIGPLQNVTMLIEMMASVTHVQSFHFLFFGSGRSRQHLEAEIERRSLPNVTVLDPVPRDEADEMHAACDLAVIALTKGMIGISVPSRIGNTLASGRPILGLVEPDSELARLIVEADVGWRIDPDDIDEFVILIESIAAAPHELPDYQRRARLVAEQRFGREAMISKVVGIVDALSAQQISSH